MTTIKVGDKVMWKGCFGSDVAREATVTGLSLTTIPRYKYGDDVQEVTLEQVKANCVVFDLSNGHWAYSDQIVV